MKDAIGGTWIMGIFIVFIVLFAAFMAYSISYTKAFRVKNEIINIIERNEGFSESSRKSDLKNYNYDFKQDDSVESKVFEYIKAAGYDYETSETVNCMSVRGEDLGSMMTGGYCLKKVCPSSGDSEKVYYKVTTFIALSIPIFNITVKLPISGETKSMYYDRGNFGCFDSLI